MSKVQSKIKKEAESPAASKSGDEVIKTIQIGVSASKHIEIKAYVALTGKSIKDYFLELYEADRLK